MVDSLSSSSFKVGGGLAMGALGLAGGLMAAGYASGNPLMINKHLKLHKSNNLHKQ